MVFFLDGSHVSAHQHSTGIQDQAISKIIGVNSSKTHLAVDANGVKIAPDLLELLSLEHTEVVCMDKGYNSEKLREQIRERNTHANIPKRTNTKSNNDHIDWYLNKIIYLVENAFTRLK